MPRSTAPAGAASPGPSGWGPPASAPAMCRSNTGSRHSREGSASSASSLGKAPLATGCSRPLGKAPLAAARPLGKAPLVVVIVPPQPLGKAPLAAA